MNIDESIISIQQKTIENLKAEIIYWKETEEYWKESAKYWKEKYQKELNKSVDK